MREGREGGVPVDDVDLFRAQNVPQDRQRPDDGRQDALVVERHQG